MEHSASRLSAGKKAWLGQTKDVETRVFAPIEALHHRLFQQVRDRQPERNRRQPNAVGMLRRTGSPASPDSRAA